MILANEADQPIDDLIAELDANEAKILAIFWGKRSNNLSSTSSSSTTVSFLSTNVRLDGSRKSASRSTSSTLVIESYPLFRGAFG